MRRVPATSNLKPMTTRIDTLSHDGRGVARIEGKATFIQGALPNEVVQFKYTKVKKDFDEGELLSVVEASPLRTLPKCEHYAHCGGCSLQHLDEKEQIHLKEEQLLDLIARFGHSKPERVLSPLTGPHWNYRNKARLSVRFVEKKQTTLVGFRERNNPRYVMEMTHCPILNARVDADIMALRQLINTLEAKHCIAQVEVAAGDDDVGLIFRHLEPLHEIDLEKIKAFAQIHHYKIFLQAKGPDSIVCIYPPNASVTLSYRLAFYSLIFEFHPSDFTQVNSTLNQKMVRSALQLMDLKPRDTVLDLFCGLGNFTLPMAKFCAKVVGVEGSETMVTRAYRNAKNNQLSNVEFFAANLEDGTKVTTFLGQSFNKLLIDPPRAGAFEIVKQMDLLNPERIVYISCNPVTLARDIDVLVNQKGYRLESAGVLDMFPHTSHVESIASFVKG